MATDAWTPWQQDPESFQQVSVTGLGATSPSAPEGAQVEINPLHAEGDKDGAPQMKFIHNVEMEWLREGGCVLNAMVTTDETAG